MFGSNFECVFLYHFSGDFAHFWPKALANKMSLWAVLSLFFWAFLCNVRPLPLLLFHASLTRVLNRWLRPCGPYRGAFGPRSGGGGTPPSNSPAKIFFLHAGSMICMHGGFWCRTRDPYGSKKIYQKNHSKPVQNIIKSVFNQLGKNNP